jgi:hypothetical protein
LDEDDLRIDRGDLVTELGFAISGHLSAEHDQVERSCVEAANDVGEVVRRLGLVAKAAKTRDGAVENDLTLADQEHAPLCVTCRLHRPSSVVG